VHIESPANEIGGGRPLGDRRMSGQDRALGRGSCRCSPT
jgi:hypothetical protein